MCKGTNTTAIDVSYLIMDSILPYNIILGRLAINVIGEIISTLYLVLKYPLPGGQVIIIQGDQQIA